MFSDLLGGSSSVLGKPLTHACSCEEVLEQPAHSAASLVRAARTVGCEGAEAQKQLTEWMVGAAQMLLRAEQPSQAARTYQELGQLLQGCGQCEQASECFGSAAELYIQCACMGLGIASLEAALQCNVSGEDFEAGMHTSTQLLRLSCAVAPRVARRAAVFKVLFGVAKRCLVSTEQAITELKSLGCRSPREERELLLLTGVVHLGAGGDNNALNQLFEELSPYLSDTQQQLCFRIQATLQALAEEVVLG